jgi:uncharacterized protein
VIAAGTPWPWYVAGALIGLVVPALLLIGGKPFGVSANLRHMCALAGSRLPLFRYDWKRQGGWNLTFALGLALGGWLAVHTMGPAPAALALSPGTTADFHTLGLTNLTGFAPPELISWSALATRAGFLTMVVGGFLVGFGARWAAGCTSGHAITGLSSGQFPSLLAVLGFFAGGLLMTHVILRWIL